MTIKRHKHFIKDLNKVKFSDSQFEKFVSYFNCFLEDKQLPPEAKNHSLKGNYLGFYEFHLGGDLLVAYYIENNVIILARIGTHSQLFN